MVWWMMKRERKSESESERAKERARDLNNCKKKEQIHKGCRSELYPYRDNERSENTF
jgi:hypothetical protein